jgi:hypothetical protein
MVKYLFVLLKIQAYGTLNRPHFSQKENTFLHKKLSLERFYGYFEKR